ncbi:MHYT domain-containing protein [Ramlibacter alkalitolerans]|uniref:Histidine kinase n=1 Tax=Ramlibacter alkalitolerans TaxID=2039631 RepID=A0ABS1JTP3_9BURK|nr:MHYT domain-containing protein [Ramlibacter alkalitolerans]MBL0427536.1 histidine kinase [Ramlibacter alkalitolerans]
MNTPVATSYQLLYVAISYGISVLGAFVALNSATRIGQADGSISVGNTIAAGLALGGIGVWAMHFIGMLALKLGVASSYAMGETLISLVAAVVATALALGFVARAPERLGRLLGAGFLLGMGVVVMHYLGMWGMKISGYIRWDVGVIALSAVIAVLAATAALWLAFNTGGVGMRVLAALIMGVAVCAMHYTGMTAAEFICTSDPGIAPDGFGYVGATSLPFVVGLVAVVVAGLIAAYHTWQDSALYDMEEFGVSVR